MPGEELLVFRILKRHLCKADGVTHIDEGGFVRKVDKDSIGRIRKPVLSVKPGSEPDRGDLIALVRNPLLENIVHPVIFNPSFDRYTPESFELRPETQRCSILDFPIFAHLDTVPMERVGHCLGFEFKHIHITHGR
ncbi:MAG: hypothetical protein HW374_1826, partial [Bacteroidetes bacterium]|nr:hypothetical protein [Bacteroidota bacterium]